MTALESPEVTFDCRDAFAETLASLARVDRRIVAVCNDSVGSSNLVAFRREFTERTVNVGIAEQNMVGVAAGLANGGLVPFICAAAPFLCTRALEQIKVDLAYSGVRAVLCAMSPGVAYGALGPTHHCPEDLSTLRAIPGISIAVPADPSETRAALAWALEQEGPSYVRIGRLRVPELPRHGERFGEGVVLRAGDDVSLIATGTMVTRALAAAGLLAAEGIEARVINLPVIRPLDETILAQAAAETKAIVTVEEAASTGGLGAAVAEWVVAHRPLPMRLIGFPEAFAPTGAAEQLFEHFGLTPGAITSAAAELLASVPTEESRPEVDVPIKLRAHAAGAVPATNKEQE